MRFILILFVLISPMPIVAHPYIYIEAEVEVVQANGAPHSVRITWRYDEEFSDTLLADFGLDLDGDGILTLVEQNELSVLVTEWPPGFRGDLYLVDPDDPETLGYPGARSDHEAALENGQLIEQFMRLIPDSAPLNIAIYDPAYVSYYKIMAVTVSGEGPCTAQIIPADRMAAQAKLSYLINQMPEGTEEMAFPAVGRDFADMVRVICD